MTTRLNRAGRLLIAGFLLLAGIVAMSVLFAARERISAAAVQSDLVNQDRLEDLLSSIRQAESGLRGYMLTGNDASVVTYNLAVKDIPAELETLDKTFGDSAEANHLADLHRLTADKLQQLNTAMTLYRSGQDAAAIGLVNTDLNLQTMQQLRNLVGVMQGDQSRRLAEMRAADTRDGWLLQAATTAAVLGTVLLAWFVLLDNQRQTSALRAAQAALTGANEALERKVEERTATLRASEAEFRTLAETLPGFVFMSGPAGGNTYVNPQFRAYTGLTSAQALADGWSTVLHPDDVAATLAARRQSLADGTIFEMEYRFRRHDGVYLWFLGRSVPLRDHTGAITGWIGTCTDIDERKQSEAALAEYNSTLERRVAERTLELDRIFRLSTDILMVSRSDGTMVSVSPAWERITGFPVAEVIGRRFFDYVHPDDLGLTRDTSDEVHEGTPVTGFENRYRHADGSYRWLSWRTTPLVEEGLAFSVARDITQEKAREEQLRQSQKMEVVGQLTGGVAHDFNNLLTIIMGSLELLQRSLSNNADPKTLRRAEAAMDAARRAAALTHRLLAFSRRQPLIPKTIEANRLLAGMSDMLHRTLGEAVAIEFVAGAGLWPALADANQLENAVLNLAVNARDAMPGGGHLTIETCNAYLDESYTAAHDDVAPGQYVQIAVTDTGAGMTADIRARLFEPFFTTKPQGQGTGLGLAQVYGFIKQSGGHVAVYSEPGEGTTVKLYLPRHYGAAADAGPPEAGTAPRPGGFETILLVEDEDGVRGFSAEVLTELGYRVLTAENAAAALRIFESEPRIDMLFTDIVLTGNRNGRQLADDLRARRPGLIVLYTTGYTRNAIIHHGRLDEGINFIGKPFTAGALGQTVRRLFDQTVLSSD